MVTNTKVDTETFTQITEGHHELDLPSENTALRVGDTLLLEEWDADQQAYTGRKIEAVVTAGADPTGSASSKQQRIHFEPKDSKYTPAA